MVTTAEILIVEDDVAILDTLAYNLARHSFEVHKATDGAKALKLAPKRLVGRAWVLVSCGM